MTVHSSQYFSFTELQCKCGCGEAEMDSAFMTKLDILRHQYGKPIHLSSAYRCAEHNKNEGGVPGSPHTMGRAVDILVSGSLAHKIITVATGLNIPGIGVSQKGDHDKRFIHLDDTDGPTRPWVWTY